MAATQAQEEAVKIVTKALGKSIPYGAQIHHVDENRFNNEPSNLVLCEGASYHKILHRRMEALAVCGHANWRRCNYCKEYDDPSKLKIYERAVWHRKCHKQYTANNAKRQRKYAKEYYKKGRKGKRTIAIEAINHFLVDLGNC